MGRMTLLSAFAASAVVMVHCGGGDADVRATDSSSDAAPPGSGGADAEQPADANAPHDGAPAVTPDSGLSDAGQNAVDGGGIDADADAGAACSTKINSCSYHYINHPAAATQRDKDSFRETAGYYCATAAGSTWVDVDDCGFTGKCATDGGASSCVSCGEASRKLGYRTIDGNVSEDCLGCNCTKWNVYNCYGAGQGGYAQPWVDVVWQVNFDVLRSFIANDGSLLYDVCPTGATCDAPVIQMVSADISPGGLVEIDITRRLVKPDNFGTPHEWQLHGHIVHRCK